MERAILTVGYKKGEIDFGVSGSVYDLSYDQMQELRAMVCVAIGTMEDMWRRNHADVEAEECAKKLGVKNLKIVE